MEFLQDLLVHARPVVEAVHEAGRDDAHQVFIAPVVFGEQDQMVIAVFAGAGFAVQTGARRDVHLAAEDRMDAFLLAGLVEVDDAVHDAVAGDG